MPHSHDRMFETDGKVERERTVTLVRAAGLDERRTAADLADPKLKAEVRKNLDLGRALGLTGTPTFIVGDRILSGAVGYDKLAAAIAAARRGRRGSVAGSMSARFDVVVALRRIGGGFWHDFAGIVVLGFGMVTVPQVALALAGTHGGSTVIATFAGLLRVLFVVIVTHGALARIAGRPLPPHAFAGAGLAASPRAMSTALLQGIAVVVVLVALLLAGLTGPAALAVRAAVVAGAFAGAVLTVAAVPLALTRRTTPWAAIAGSAALTRGRRSGVAVTLGWSR